MTKQEWIEKAKEIIKNNQEFIDEIEDMVGSDYSRHRSRSDQSRSEIKFLQEGIRLIEDE